MAEKYPGVPYEKICSDTNKIIQLFLKRSILLSEGSEEKLKYTPYFMKYIDSFFNNELSAPVRVACEVTFACNARCMHCYASYPRKSDELSTAEWKEVIDQIHNMNVFSVSFTGGEPLLRDDLEKIISYAHKKKMRTHMATNGILLTRDRIEKLRKAGIGTILVSLDGPSPEIHDTFRGVEGLFEKVVTAIKYLIKEGIDTGILTTISKLNLKKIPEHIDFVNALGVSRLALMRFINSGRAMENKELKPTPQEYIELLSQIYEKEKQLKTTSILYPDLPALFYSKSIGLDRYEELKINGEVELCGAGITSCAISPTGDVKPCDVSGDVKLGNVRSEPLKYIWDNADIFKKLRKIRKRDQKSCNLCTFNDICLTGCKALPFQVGENGDIYSVDPTCEQCFNSFQRGNADV